jgi:hypothetical protein
MVIIIVQIANSMQNVAAAPAGGFYLNLVHGVPVYKYTRNTGALARAAHLHDDGSNDDGCICFA